MTVDLEFFSFNPDRGHSGTQISATLLRSAIPDDPVEAVPMGAMFTPEGEGHPFTAENVVIQDNSPGGFTQYRISVPENAFIGEYAFEVMVRFVPKDKTLPQFLAKIRSRSHFKVTQEAGARLANLIPNTVKAATFEGKTFNLHGVHLDQIDAERNRLSQQPKHRQNAHPI